MPAASILDGHECDPLLFIIIGWRHHALGVVSLDFWNAPRVGGLGSIEEDYYLLLRRSDETVNLYHLDVWTILVRMRVRQSLRLTDSWLGALRDRTVDNVYSKNARTILKSTLLCPRSHYSPPPHRSLDLHLIPGSTKGLARTFSKNSPHFVRLASAEPQTRQQNSPHHHCPFPLVIEDIGSAAQIRKHRQACKADNDTALAVQEPGFVLMMAPVCQLKKPARTSWSAEDDCDMAGRSFIHGYG